MPAMQCSLCSPRQGCFFLSTDLEIHQQFPLRSLFPSCVLLHVYATPSSRSSKLSFYTEASTFFVLLLLLLCIAVVLLCAYPTIGRGLDLATVKAFYSPSPPSSCSYFGVGGGLVENMHKKCRLARARCESSWGGRRHAAAHKCDSII